MIYLHKIMAPFLFPFFLFLSINPAIAKTAQVVEVPSGVKLELIGYWDKTRLNNILQQETPQFAGITVKYSAATNGVRLYRVTYPSVVPERGNKPTVASGLLAIPDIKATTLPMVSYQHGTVYGKQQVPSFPEQSPETALMIAQFAGQGYVVIGADYFGMGESSEPEGYMVKGSHQQASYDMLQASRAVLKQMQISTPKLFLAGWSQGGFVTMAFLEKLEQVKEPVLAAVTASAPTDIFMTLSGFLNFPRKNDADWVPTLFILSAFSFEHYYGVPGLARSVINDDYYEVARNAYEKKPFNAADIPTDLHKLVRAEYFDPQFFAASAYGRLIADTQAYRWVIKTPVKNYYGEADEAISVGLGKLPMTYQQAMGNGNPQVQAISTGQTSHRGTFASAVPQWKMVFDGDGK
ncbi:alpha/beta hydrolase family protein [Yersinia mollaretii]|uniref:alpha/beta hydrolase family protein n=1 Tax=Yersinia mollaretii TaxID=33060 RepID=UPI0005DC153B|nr:alpha/beta fold hydrolase [Yersinia mollaretii]MDA5527545.1 prolyl oligopeptidase family serine peptidase [Yersinia mollaretii]MDR7875082.1 prolyl oligopeptidase family serine peptidase [Yersinia mollaretii]WQC74839.1 prolyl oligopeptidase family serine peptidase [Yersinia mollaretii]CNE00444.1 Alpha/beta hydrolase family [Yersinia mollaretii]CQJ21191.1 Alpha/beta hydrolase family [Yersinia mollaretii]